MQYNLKRSNMFHSKPLQIHEQAIKIALNTFKTCQNSYLNKKIGTNLHACCLCILTCKTINVKKKRQNDKSSINYLLADLSRPIASSTKLARVVPAAAVTIPPSAAEAEAEVRTH